MPIKIYLEIPPKNGKKVGIHFYENILSEINLPLGSEQVEYSRLCKYFPSPLQISLSFIGTAVSNF